MTTPSNKLKPGCYLLSFRPENGSQSEINYVGTMRVTCDSANPEAATVASGDLYEIAELTEIEPSDRLIASSAHDWRVLALNVDGPIPTFPVNNYSYYLDVQKVSDTTSGVTLDLQAHKFDGETNRLVPGAMCQLVLTPDDDKGQTRFYGELMGAQGKRGEFYLQYLGPTLRRAKVRLFTLPAEQEPSIDLPGLGAGPDELNDPWANKKLQESWQGIFGKIRWHLDIEAPQLPNGEIEFPELPDINPKIQSIPLTEWTPYDLGVNATTLRQGIQPNAWVYDLLCVSRFQHSSYLGMMFDSEATDLNSQPRESAAVAALQDFPTLQNGESFEPFQKAEAGRLYLRTALHELGHCMNLTHSLATGTLMDTTDCLRSKDDPTRTGTDFKMEFAPEDVFWLQHAPDIAVRPGGVGRQKLHWQRRQRSRTTTVMVRSEPGLTLSLSPVDKEIPFGAPARFNFTLANQGPTVFVPKDISLRGGCLSGKVLGPDQVPRYFRSAFKCCDSVRPDGRLEPLLQGKSLEEDGMTLLRGIDAPLFPRPGIYQITVELRWDHQGQTRQVVGGTSIVVQDANPTDPFQREAAAVALNEPFLMPAIVQGRLEGESIVALGLALNSTILAPYYAATALKCYDYGERHGYGRNDWEQRVEEAVTKHASRYQRRLTNLTNLAKNFDPEALGRIGRFTARERRQLKRYIPPGQPDGPETQSRSSAPPPQPQPPADGTRITTKVPTP